MPQQNASFQDLIQLIDQLQQDITNMAGHQPSHNRRKDDQINILAIQALELDESQQDILKLSRAGYREEEIHTMLPMRCTIAGIAKQKEDLTEKGFNLTPLSLEELVGGAA